MVYEFRNRYLLLVAAVVVIGALLSGCDHGADNTNETAAPSVVLPPGATPGPTAKNKPIPGGNATLGAGTQSSTGKVMAAPK